MLILPYGLKDLWYNSSDFSNFAILGPTKKNLQENLSNYEIILYLPRRIPKWISAGP
jgi:hypothetical protein